MGDGENVDEESMESDIAPPPTQPTFQNFLMQFLDNKAPVLGKVFMQTMKQI